MDGATCNQSLVAITPTNPARAFSGFLFWTLRSMYLTETEFHSLHSDADELCRILGAIQKSTKGSANANS